MNATERPIGRVLSELAEERGFSGLEELAEAINAAPEHDDVEPYTAEELSYWPRPGFGKHVNAVLRLGPAQRMYLAGAVWETCERA